ncbi:heparin sulfate O-sulfotransferase-like isoform X2 [Eurytemora carolleeae]|uniref:heparin sulfate O-sulfotransferase-like isoform X2 n=1 Tax=Eurytemora carolleeae TaxID=1294199 RepID=UPI000C78CD66|nr:heparin sulfate O-sulfotransferase-like isoform X2 [Eurytemora carolleeae]|eukprot:XP_023345285.1 heparin sulfate O-sulfotransferase-like isoform X2 [Eurytemora affinis]
MGYIKFYLIFVVCCTFIFFYLYVHTQPTSAKDLTRPPVLMYNRIPKTGSTSLMNIAYEIRSQNRYRIVQVRLTSAGSKNILSFNDQLEISRNISAWSSLPLLFHGHFAYFEPSTLGVDVHPVFINLIRKPLERLVSYYYFLRYGDDILEDKVRSKQGDTTTFDECVERNQPDCDPKKLWMQIPFFCGSSPHCWEPGSSWALEQAKQNLINKYLVVGVTEDLESFVTVLELLLPQYFAGGVQYLRDTGKAHIKRTKHKDPVSQQTIDKMKRSKVFQLELEFYNFALKHFKYTKKTVTSNKHNFVYEKVRPKY